MNNKKKIICIGAVVLAIIVAIIVISLVLVYTRKPKDEVDIQDKLPDITLENGVGIDVVVALDDEFLSQY